jgi:GNAT superfamily N-acetyltransferase
MPDLTFRPARADDTPEILGLIAASYRQHTDPARSAYWQWKHAANPFGTSPCLLAESNGRLVGVRAFLRWHWDSGGRSVRAVRAVDTATHPEWQGRGIFSKLTLQLVDQMQGEGVSFVYNTPNAKSMPGYLKMGWTLVTRIPLWIRPLRVYDVVRRGFTSVPPQTPALPSLVSVKDVVGDSRLRTFLTDVAVGDERYHTVRTLEYLRWRYAQIPGFSYQARFDFDGDAGALVIARGRCRGRLREMTICELIVTPSPRGAEIARSLVADVARAADADYAAACAARGTAEQAVLARSGFVPAPRLGPHFTARRLGPVTPDPSRWDSWRCSIGDLELF